MLHCNRWHLTAGRGTAHCRLIWRKGRLTLNRQASATSSIAHSHVAKPLSGLRFPSVRNRFTGRVATGITDGFVCSADDEAGLISAARLQSEKCWITQGGEEMKPVRLTCMTATVLLAALAAHAQPQKAHGARYIIKDLGTLGGSDAEAGGISNNGWVEGFSTLPPDDSVIHSFLWRNGVMIDLGTLGGPNSFSEWQPNQFGN